MSMISALIDELRRMADGQATYRDAREVMLRAADTIWELRDDLQQANAENAKLREELGQWERLTAGIELPEYPITQFQPKDLERENAKLRKLADAVKEFVEDVHCEDCPCRRDCDDNNVFFCVNDLSYHAFAAMRELGMEVDG